MVVIIIQKRNPRNRRVLDPRGRISKSTTLDYIWRKGFIISVSHMTFFICLRTSMTKACIFGTWSRSELNLSFQTRNYFFFAVQRQFDGGHSLCISEIFPLAHHRDGGLPTSDYIWEICTCKAIHNARLQQEPKLILSVLASCVIQFFQRNWSLDSQISYHSCISQKEIGPQ